MFYKWVIKDRNERKILNMPEAVHKQMLEYGHIQHTSGIYYEFLNDVACYLYYMLMIKIH